MALSKINIAVNNTGGAKPAIKTTGTAPSKIAEQADSAGSEKKGLISNDEADFAKVESLVAERLGRDLTEAEKKQLVEKLASQSTKLDSKTIAEDFANQVIKGNWEDKGAVDLSRAREFFSNPDNLRNANDAKSVAENFGLETAPSSGASGAAAANAGPQGLGAQQGGGYGAGGINISQTQSQMQIQDSSPIQQMRIEHGVPEVVPPEIDPGFIAKQSTPDVDFPE